MLFSSLETGSIVRWHELSQALNSPVCESRTCFHFSASLNEQDWLTLRRSGFPVLLSSDNARQLIPLRQGSLVSSKTPVPPRLCDGRTMLLKRVSTVSATTRPVPTSSTPHQLSLLRKSRSVRFQARNLNLSHVLRPVFSTIHPLILSKFNPMASFGYSSSSASSAASTPAGTASPSPSSSISSLASLRMSPSNKRASLSNRSIGGINTALGNTAALENSFKAASLDTMRGYSQNAYAVVQQTHETESIPRPRARGYQLLREPAWNKGWASIVVSIPKPVADVLYRHFIYARRKGLPEPYWPHPPRHGEHGHSMHASHEDGPQSVHQH
jgi:hypothetical protein